MEVPREATALVVVDVQNGFCHPEGSFAQLDLDVSMCTAAIAGCRSLVEAAREGGLPVVYTRYAYRPDYADGGVLVQHLLPALAEVGSLAAGTWDAELVDELRDVRTDEFVVDKARYSAFYGTGLEPILTSLGVRALVVCGVTTNMCVETTVRDASQRDYRTWVVSDATGELDRARHDAALATMGFGFGWITSVAEVRAAWAAAAASS